MESGSCGGLVLVNGVFAYNRKLKFDVKEIKAINDLVRQ
jgi:hypothetical protein